MYEGNNDNIKVVDILGQEINFNHNRFERSIKFNNLNSGIYFLIIIDEQNKITKKFIVKS